MHLSKQNSFNFSIKIAAILGRAREAIKLNLQGVFVKVYGCGEDEILMANDRTALKQQ